MNVEERILLLALRGRDASVIERLLERSGWFCVACSGVDHLAKELLRGAGAVLVTEESLAEADTSALLDALGQQAAWSDFPFILLSTKRSGRRSPKAQNLLNALGNVVVLERPIHGETLDSAVASALRGRRRQYEARRHLRALQQAESELRRLNGTLEDRIVERTDELSHANNLLMQEIAERERAQAALVQSQKMEAVGQLTGGIAHDFNNLLTVITGNFELIQRRARDDRLTVLAGYGLQASERAVKLTSQLLAFSRTEKLALRPVEINSVIAGLNDLLPRSLGPEHRIDVQLASDAPWAMADANQLELAVLNLALNGRDAMPDGGLLRIAVRCAKPDGLPLPDGNYVVIGVSDDGAGVPEDLIDKVFDPFFTTKSVGKGTGLGLSQVYAVAQQFGGLARIQSPPGEGCTVEIWLPRAESPAVEAGAPLPGPSPITEGRRVLVVEDDKAVRRYLVECLGSLGCEVIESSDGVEGLAKLDAANPEIMIVDYAMPGMNGVEVIKVALQRRPDLPIIMATGYADMEAVRGVIGAEQVLRKPFRLTELAQAIADAFPASTATIGA